MKLPSAPSRRLSVLLVCLALGACWGGDDDPNAVAREAFEARRDRVAPTLTLASPTSAASMESLNATVTLAGTANDDRVIARVTWVNDRGGSGLAYQDSASASVTWRAGNITLADGSNNIVLRAYDKAGNSAVRTLQVNYSAATPPPVPTDPAPAPDPSQPAPAPIPAPPGGPVTTAPGDLRWSDANTWGGAVPGVGAEVVVPAGATVVLDTNTAALGNLRIEGTLRFAAADVELKAAAIQVSGALQIGSQSAPHLNRATITLSGAPLATDNNGIARGLNVQGGRLELYGAVPQPIWTRLGDHAAAGATGLTLAAASNWRAGDTIAVGPSDFYGVSATERLVLSADAAGQRLATRSPLGAVRWGRLQYATSTGMSLTPEPGYSPPVTPAPTVLDERAPVANLTRNIVIQGADDSHWRNGFGAHVMVMGLQSKIVIDGVEMRRMGQAGTLGRYPMHWHMLSYTNGQHVGDAVGHSIKNSAIWQSANRCIVIHATNGVEVKNNICHDIAGHAYFLEDAVERRNVLEGNLALMIRAPAPGKVIKLHESASQFQAGSSGFWLTNPDNTVRGNLVGDAQGNGFWLAFPRKPSGLSANVAMLPDRLPFGVFDNNVAHSNAQPGINLDWAPTDEAGTVSPNRYIPTTDGRENDYTNQIRMAMRRNTIYKNGSGNVGSGGFWNRVALPDYPEWVSADNAGVHFAGSGDDGRITRGLFVGHSLNHSSSTYPQGAEPPSAFATYHSTYSMRDNTLVNFPFVDGKSSGVFRTNDYYTSAVDKGTVRNGNNRLIASHPGYRTPPPHLDGAPLANRHWTYAGALWDPNGYWGPKNNYWVYDQPFLTAGATCQPVAPAGKNGQSCAGEYYGVGAFQTDFDMSRYAFNAPIEVTRQDGNGATIGVWSIQDGATSTMLGHMRHFAARPGARYVLRFPGRPNPRFFAMTVGNAFRASDSMLMAVAFDGNTTASGYTVSGYDHHRQAPQESNTTRPFTSAQSLAEVIASPGTKLWQDRASHLVWFKLQGGLAYPHAATLPAESDDAIYRNMSVVLQGG